MKNIQDIKTSGKEVFVDSPFKGKVIDSNVEKTPPPARAFRKE